MSEQSSAPAVPAATTESAAPVESTQSESEVSSENPIQEAKPKEDSALAKKKIQALKEKFKFVVDGQEVEEEIDLSDREALKKRFQLGYASEKRMAEAKAAQHKAMSIVKAFEEDPANIFKRMGPKGREAAEKFLLEQIQEDMMSPEEKEFKMTKAELAKYKADDEKRKVESEKQALTAQESKYAQEYQTTIISALEKSGLPKTPTLVRDAAKLMAKNLELGLDLDANDLAALIKESRGGDIKAMIKDMDGDQIVSLLGDDVANKIRKADLKKLKEKQGQVFQSGQSGESKSPGKQPQTQSIREWKEQLDQKFGG